MDRKATVVINRCTELKNFWSCPQCGEQFTKSTSRQRFCSQSCQYKYWCEHNRDRQNYNQRAWRRRNGGEPTKVGRIRLPEGERKRPFTGACELCGRVSEDGARLLDYHHWDDEMPAMGMYLCARCHVLAEGIESELDTAYRDVRYKIEKEYAMEQLAKIGIPLEVLDG